MPDFALGIQQLGVKGNQATVHCHHTEQGNHRRDPDRRLQPGKAISVKGFFDPTPGYNGSGCQPVDHPIRRYVRTGVQTG